MRLPLPVLLLVTASTLSCAHTRGVATAPPQPPADPCSGESIQLEAVTTACKASDTRMPAPPEGALETRLAVSKVEVRSGETVTVRAELVNVTGESLEVFLSPLAGYLTAIVDTEKRVDELWLEERLGGLSGSVRPLRVVLEPGGVIWSDFEVSARVTTLGYEALEAGGYRTATGDGGPIPPGEYTLQVYLPLTGEHPFSFPGGYGNRSMVELPLHVAP